MVQSIRRFDPATGMFQTAGYDISGSLIGVDFPIVAGEGYLIHMVQGVAGFVP